MKLQCQRKSRTFSTAILAIATALFHSNPIVAFLILFVFYIQCSRTHLFCRKRFDLMVENDEQSTSMLGTFKIAVAVAVRFLFVCNHNYCKHKCAFQSNRMTAPWSSAAAAVAATIAHSRQNNCLCGLFYSWMMTPFVVILKIIASCSNATFYAFDR